MTDANIPAIPHRLIAEAFEAMLDLTGSSVPVEIQHDTLRWFHRAGYSLPAVLAYQPPKPVHEMTEAELAALVGLLSADLTAH